MTYMEDYKGYSASISLDEKQDVFHGEVMGITDVVTFEGKTPEELRKAFHDSVDDYLAFCAEREEKPDKPYSGRFVLRLSPELHRQAAVSAKRADMSMNEWIVALVEKSLEERPLSPGASLTEIPWPAEWSASAGPSRAASFLPRQMPGYDWALVTSLMSALTAALSKEAPDKIPKRSPRRVR